MGELREKKPLLLCWNNCAWQTEVKKGIELNLSGPGSKSVVLPPPSLCLFFFFFFFVFFLQHFLLLPHETSHLHFRTSAKLIFWSLAAPQWYQRDQVKQHPTLALCCVSIMQRRATMRKCLLCLFCLQCTLCFARWRASSAVYVCGCAYYAQCYSAISHRAGVIQLDLECELFLCVRIQTA